MARIKLTQGKYALVDLEDVETLSKNKWSYDAHGGVARTGIKGKTVLMHRLIMGAPHGVEVDHINLDTLDNRKENLRIATRSQNAANRRRQSNNTSGYKGVSWNKQRKKWHAYICVENKAITIGRFHSPKEAALAYNKAALTFFGEYARLNVIKE